MTSEEIVALMIVTAIITVMLVLFILWLLAGRPTKLDKYKDLSDQLSKEQKYRNELSIKFDTTGNLDFQDYVNRELKISNKKIAMMEAKLAKLDSKLGLG